MAIYDRDLQQRLSAIPDNVKNRPYGPLTAKHRKSDYKEENANRPVIKKETGKSVATTKVRDNRQSRRPDPASTDVFLSAVSFTSGESTSGGTDLVARNFDSKLFVLVAITELCLVVGHSAYKY